MRCSYMRLSYLDPVRFFCASVLCLSACSLEQPEIIVRLRPPQAKPSEEPTPTLAPAVTTRTGAIVTVSAASPGPSGPSPETSASPILPAVIEATPTAQPSASPTAPPLLGAGGGLGLSNGGSNTSGPVSPAVVQVGIAGVAETTLTVGESLQLFGKVYLADGTTHNQIFWESQQPQVAGINYLGQVTAHSPGEVLLTATAAGDPSKKINLSLTVVAPTLTFEGQISFTRNNDIYLFKGQNTNPLRLTHTGPGQEKIWPRLSWNGDKVVWRVQANDFYSIVTTGTGTPVLHDLPDSDLSHVPYYWYNDEIIYLDWDTGNPGLYNLWRIKPNGTTQGWSNILGVMSGPVGGISPFGLVAYEQSGNIKTSQYNSLANRVDHGTGQDVRMAHSNQPKWIVYSQNEDIIRVNLADGSKTPLSPLAGYDGQAALSPDEKQVVFVSTRGNGSKDIFIMNIDGTGVQNLTNTPNLDEFQPDWSH